MLAELLGKIQVILQLVNFFSLFIYSVFRTKDLLQWSFFLKIKFMVLTLAVCNTSNRPLCVHHTIVPRRVKLYCSFLQINLRGRKAVWGRIRFLMFLCCFWFCSRLPQQTRVTEHIQCLQMFMLYLKVSLLICIKIYVVAGMTTKIF